MQNVYSFTRTVSPEDDEATVRQEAVDAAHRALTHGSDGLRNFPLFLGECFERRVWEHDRVFAGGTRQAPVSFHDFVHAPYPTGLGATYETVERLIRGDAKLVEAWTKVSGRGQGKRTDLVDNINEVPPERPTGTSVEAGLRRLGKEAEAGNGIAAQALDAVKSGAKSVHRAMIECGFRKGIDPEVKAIAARDCAEAIVALSEGDFERLSAVEHLLRKAGAKNVADQIANLVDPATMDRGAA